MFRKLIFVDFWNNNINRGFGPFAYRKKLRNKKFARWMGLKLGARKVEKVQMAAVCGVSVGGRRSRR